MVSVNLTIAGKDEEFVFLTDFMYSDIGISSDDLLLGNHSVILFEIKIAQSSR
jgi:hypothetical protein